MLVKITKDSQISKLVEFLRYWEFREGCSVTLRITNLYVDVHIYDGATLRLDGNTKIEILSITEFGAGSLFNGDSLLNAECDISHGFHTIIEVNFETINGVNKLTQI